MGGGGGQVWEGEEEADVRGGERGKYGRGRGGGRQESGTTITVLPHSLPSPPPLTPLIYLNRRKGMGRRRVPRP